MAPPGAGRRARRRSGGGDKPRAHKRRRGGGGTRPNSAVRGNAGGGGGAVNASIGANWKNRRRYRPGRTGSANVVSPAERGNINGTTTANIKRDPDGSNFARSKRNRGNSARRGKGKAVTVGLQPIKVKSSGIMSTWKKPLGGLIRYYVNTRMNGRVNPVDQKTAEEEIDMFYYRSLCSVEDTKARILQALGVPLGDQQDWINISMAIEKDGQLDNIPILNGGNGNEDSMDTSNGNGDAGFAKTVDGRGIKLKQVLRAGEGPAHSTEQWTTIVVPEWAVGKSYFFEVRNNSPLNLSCELFLDGEKVAFNAPIRPNSTGTIRPNAVRYYQRHQWVLNDAVRKRVDFVSVGNSTPTGSGTENPAPRLVTPRYNGIRPDYEGERVSSESYPDPTQFGWLFTGSVQESRVEFFEKAMNIGGCVKMDFYYTTGTIKTVLHHPTTGKNQLFRAKVTPEQYVEVMKNPRSHTGQGYRKKEDRPPGNQEEEDDDKFDRPPTNENEGGQTGDDADMDDASASARNDDTRYYARDTSYDFKKKGHQNRLSEMNKLQQSNAYAEWKEANKKEYAVVHAKSYVSVPKYRAPPKSAAGRPKQRKGKQMNPLPLPEQTAVIDVKAAENATLGTKYKSTGPPQTIHRSSVRMERINGLTDDKAWKGEPVFEKKLYYRAEKIVSGGIKGDDSDDDMSEDGNADASQNLPLNVYKSEKIDQVMQFHSELSAYISEPEESQQKLRNVKNKIHLSESIADVELFHNDLIHRQMVGNRT